MEMTNLSCLCFIVSVAVFILFVYLVSRKKTDQTRAETILTEAEVDPSPEELGLQVPGSEFSDADPVFRETEQLLSLGKRDEAVSLLLQAFRKGSPEVRKEASRILENLGEIDDI